MKFYSRQRKMPQVIIVSLIDVFVILLIFVIMTTTFKKAQPSLTIELPVSKSATNAAPSQMPVVLTISPNEEIYMDSRKVSLEELKGEVEAMVKSNAKHGLALNADKKAPFGLVIKVIDVLREAGVKGNLAAFMEATKS